MKISFRGWAAIGVSMFCCFVWVGFVAASARAAIEWTHLGLAGEAVKSIAFSPDWSVDRTLFATNFFYGSLYRSYDAGSTWQTATPWGRCRET